MEYIHDTTEFYINRPSAVMLGKFDGLHRGHRRLLERVLALQRQGYYGIAFTIAPENRPVLLLPEEKRNLLQALGINCMLRCPFIPEILSMEPETFVRDVLSERLHAGYIVVGTDFRFGHNRRGDVALLTALQKQYGYRLIVVEKERYEGREISSTYVREALAAGDTGLAGRLLGAPYPIEGRIRHGRRLGRALGMPTINLVPPAGKLLPPYGVYYSKVWIGEPGKETSPAVFQETQEEGGAELQNGFCCPGITNIGCKPTVDGSFTGVETYLYGVHADLYGRFVRVSLYDFRRGEQRFSSVSELQAQMECDIRAGADYWSASSRAFRQEPGADAQKHAGGQRHES